MRIAYHFAIPRPPVPELDGAVQEALWLQERFGGTIDYLYPARSFRRWLPASLSGLGQGRRLAELDRRVDLHHLFSGELIRYPFLGRLKKPIVYTLTTSLATAPGARLEPSASGTTVAEPPQVDGPRPGVSPEFARRWVVADAADASYLGRHGFANVDVVRPGIDLERFRPTPPPASDELVLLAGSAPWSRRQFRTKGLDLLLDAVAEIPDLRLVLLWREVLVEEIRKRIAGRGLANRVELIEETVQIEEVLERVHAAVVLSAAPKLIKAYPHSLLEAVASARPVMVSAGLAMAELVDRAGCGVVVDELSRTSLERSIAELRRNYPALQSAAAAFDREPFSRSLFLADYERIYRAAVDG